MCTNMTNCDNAFCVKRHPKTCKFLAKNNKYRLKTVPIHMRKAEILMLNSLRDVTELKKEIKERKKTNKDISKTLGEVFRVGKDIECNAIKT